MVLSKTTSAPGPSPPLGVPLDHVVVQHGVPELVGLLVPLVDCVDILVIALIVQRKRVGLFFSQVDSSELTTLIHLIN